MPSNQIAEGFVFCSLNGSQVDTFSTRSCKNLTPLLRLELIQWHSQDIEAARAQELHAAEGSA